MTPRDEVYQRRRDQLVDFTFDRTVAEVFPDMIRRSVPGYETVVPLTGLLAARAMRAGGPPPEGGPPVEGGPPLAYDLGCSLGATALAVARQLGDAPGRIIAVDSASAMIERARVLVADPRIEFVCADIREVPLEPARTITLNYVLQFLPPEHRLDMLRRLRGALARDGLLIVSEKIRFDDPETQREFEAAHLDFKRANGYSELEISQKRSALENVMIIDTETVHRERFEAAGFSRVRKWYQCLNWASFEVRP